MSPQKVKANLSFGPNVWNPKSRKMKVWEQVSAGCGENGADPKPNTTENEARNSQLCNSEKPARVFALVQSSEHYQRNNAQGGGGDVTVQVCFRSGRACTQQ